MTTPRTPPAPDPRVLDRLGMAWGRLRTAFERLEQALPTEPHPLDEMVEMFTAAQVYGREMHRSGFYQACLALGETVDEAAVAYEVARKEQQT